eukprot:COSAG06_NODE_3312_length_5521_cov_2.846736_4_plen_36_part_00
MAIAIDRKSLFLGDTAEGPRFRSGLVPGQHRAPAN